VKIEEGKYYRTRDGRKAFIYKIHDNESSSHPVHGCYWNGKFTKSQAWNPGGHYLSSIESSVDLVAEWIEPVRVEVSVAWDSCMCDGVKFVYPAETMPRPKDSSLDWDALIGRRGKLIFEEEV
jgi:hypothetical protein